MPFFTFKFVSKQSLLHSCKKKCTSHVTLFFKKIKIKFRLRTLRENDKKGDLARFSDQLHILCKYVNLI